MHDALTPSPRSGAARPAAAPRSPRTPPAATGAPRRPPPPRPRAAAPTSARVASRGVRRHQVHVPLHRGEARVGGRRCGGSASAGSGPGGGAAPGSASASARPRSAAATRTAKRQAQRLAAARPGRAAPARRGGSPSEAAISSRGRPWRPRPPGSLAPPAPPWNAPACLPPSDPPDCRAQLRVCSLPSWAYHAPWIRLDGSRRRGSGDGTLGQGRPRPPRPRRACVARPGHDHRTAAAGVSRPSDPGPDGLRAGARLRRDLELLELPAGAGCRRARRTGRRCWTSWWSARACAGSRPAPRCGAWAWATTWSLDARRRGARGALGDVRAHADAALAQDAGRPRARPARADVPRLLRGAARRGGLGGAGQDPARAVDGVPGLVSPRARPAGAQRRRSCATCRRTARTCWRWTWRARTARAACSPATWCWPAAATAWAAPSCPSRCAACPAASGRTPRRTIDFAALRGRRVGVVGGSASAMDNAATALEAGCARLDLFVRRPDIPRVNALTGIGSPGLVHGFAGLPDAWKWRFLHHALGRQTPPPRDSTLRVSRHPHAHFHLGSPLLPARARRASALRVRTPKGALRLDLLILATGFHFDLSRRPELARLRAAHPPVARPLRPAGGAGQRRAGRQPGPGARLRVPRAHARRLPGAGARPLLQPPRHAQPRQARRRHPRGQRRGGAPGPRHRAGPVRGGPRAAPCRAGGLRHAGAPRRRVDRRGRGRMTWLARQGSKTLLFLKKKKQKDFAPFGTERDARSLPNGQEFFGSFFQKRTTLPSPHPDQGGPR